MLLYSATLITFGFVTLYEGIRTKRSRKFGD